jgi:peptide/nickel transport system substrate-binding protein
MVDGKPIRMVKVDDYTLKITSPEELGWALFALSHDGGFLPRHVLAPYHPRYNPTAKYEDFRERTSFSRLVMDPALPRISAWKAVSWKQGQRVLYERNPYYWKVDTAGNQLPYLDHVEFTVVQDAEIILLKFINGEFDLLAHNSRPSMVPTLQAERDKEVFSLHTAGPAAGPGIFLNWDVDDEFLKDAFRDKRVRLALSHAINRREISEILFHGMLEPSGFSYLPGNLYYSEESFRLHSLYDPGYARRLLEDAGYLDRDGDGIREMPDGSPFNVTVDVDLKGGLSDVMELVKDHWRAVGINANIYGGLRDFIFHRLENGDFEINLGWMRGTGEPLDSPHYWGIWAPNTPFWHKNAEHEGPDWLHEATRHIRRAMTTVDLGVRREAMDALREIYDEHVPIIGIGSTYLLWGASSRLGNVPEKVNPTRAYRAWGHTLFVQQMYVRK